MICSNILGQIKIGVYTQGVAPLFSDLSIFSNNRFSFSDLRNGGNWAETKYEGDWSLIKDTLILTYYSLWEEEAIEEKESIDTTNNVISVVFRYDDGKPIKKVKVCYACSHAADCKYFYTDAGGKAFLPKEGLLNYENKSCEDSTRALYYEIKSKFIEISTGSSWNTGYNLFKITVKKNPKSETLKQTRKFVIAGDQLLFADPYETNAFKNWGNFNYKPQTLAGHYQSEYGHLILNCDSTFIKKYYISKDTITISGSWSEEKNKLTLHLNFSSRKDIHEKDTTIILNVNNNLIYPSYKKNRKDYRSHRRMAKQFYHPQKLPPYSKYKVNVEKLRKVSSFDCTK